ncbi:hypothetical protein J2Z23_003323 [Lederbergia galactosidilyticus]|nr:hypothetical protein [Lederbergia galactosidilytica]MBP1916341.1 hypothetical protein [Lederbergia galactosidilytica]
MLFVMVTILIFSIPFIWVVWTLMDVKSGKRKKIVWKSPVILLIILVFGSIFIHIYLFKMYGFPIFLTKLETIIGLAIPGLVAGIMLIINLFITLTMGKQLSKSFHDPKKVNILASCFAFYLLIILLIATPIGKKVAFAESINQAMTTTQNADTEGISIALVGSERECLRSTSCRNTPYSNQYFIKNNLDKTQEVQVKIRALNSKNEEMKVIDTKIMTLKPNELRLLETEETIEDSSVWNQYSFQTDDRIATYQHMLRFRNPE